MSTIRSIEIGRRALLFQAVGEMERSEQPIETLDSVKDELGEFVGNIRNGTAPETGGPEALETVVVLEGIVENAGTGTVVDLDDVRARE